MSHSRTRTDEPLVLFQSQNPERPLLSAAPVKRSRGPVNALNEKGLAKNKTFFEGYTAHRTRSDEAEAPNLRHLMVLLRTQLPWRTGAVASPGPLSDWVEDNILNLEKTRQTFLIDDVSFVLSQSSPSITR